MPTLESDLTDTMPLFVMLKGEPGTRKSTQALSFPGPKYWVSTDQKMEALELPAKRWGLWGKGHLNYDDYKDWDAPKAKLEQFQVNCPFRTIVIDSITSLGDNMNRQTIKYKRGEGSGKRIGNIYVSGLEEYNAEASSFQDMMAILKDIHKFHKVNIILIAHVVGQRKDDDKNKLTHHSRVIITGGDKISGKIASYMTEVYHFDIKPGFAETDEGEYGCFTSHTGNDYARTSLPLERKIVFNSEPLYDKWIAPAIRKLKNEKSVERIPQSTQQTQSPTTSPQTTQSFTQTK
jgi:AAA domain